LAQAHGLAVRGKALVPLLFTALLGPRRRSYNGWQGRCWLYGHGSEFLVDGDSRAEKVLPFSLGDRLSGFTDIAQQMPAVCHLYGLRRSLGRPYGPDIATD
jgi:hypothetical protein